MKAAGGERRLFRPLGKREKEVSLLKTQSCFSSPNKPGREATACICYTAVSLTYIIDLGMNTRAHVCVCDCKVGQFKQNKKKDCVGSKCEILCTGDKRFHNELLLFKQKLANIL